MNIPFKKAKNKITAITAVLTAAVMSLSAAVFADTAEKAELKANGDKADVILSLPQAAAEGVSSVQISLNVSTNTDDAEITFVFNEKLGAKIQESRYHKDTGVLNIYTVGTSPLFDKADPIVNLGYVVISSNAANGAAANVAFVKGSLKFVRGSSLETYDNGLSYSEPVKILAGKGGEADPPVITDPPVVTTKDETPEPTPTQAPVETAEPPVVIPPSDGDEQPQPTDLSELKNVLDNAESFNADDYTEESFKVLQEAIAHAKEILNGANPSSEQIEEALMLLENAIGMLTKKAEQPAADITTAQNAESTSQNGENTSENAEGSSPSDGNNSSAADNNQSDPSNTAVGDSESNNGGVNPLIIILIVAGVIVVGLGVVIAVTLNKKKGGGKHSK